MKPVHGLFIKNTDCVKVLSILTLKWRGEGTFYKTLNVEYILFYNQM